MNILHVGMDLEQDCGLTPLKSTFTTTYGQVCPNFLHLGYRTFAKYLSTFTMQI